MLLTILLPAVSADVRVLWDVSQSMAQNDPENYREDALLLMLEAIPQGERAAVWTFGQYVNLLVPHDTIDAEWRALARTRIQQQGAPATRTNLGRALDEAAYDFAYSTYTGPTHVVLITDGQVDIAPNADVNQVERGRILSQLVPRYNSANARIHTIALSDDADHALLRQLSEQTGGQYLRANQGADLLPLLTSLGNEVAPVSQLRVRDSSFQVDRAVREVTVLMYHSQGAVGLRSPDGQTSSALNPGDQRWRVGRGYTQVTVSNPMTGTWRVTGDMEDPTRLRVLSDINIRWQSPDSTAVAEGSRVSIRATLTDAEGERLSGDLRDLVEAQVLVNGSPVESRVLEDRIVADIRVGDRGQQLNVTVTVNGGTFNRLAERQFQVVAPYVSEVLMTETAYEWRLYPNRRLSPGMSLAVNAEYTVNEDEMSEPFEQAEAGYWVWAFPYDQPDGDYQVQLRGLMIDGEGRALPVSGESIQLTLPIQGAAGMAMTPAVAETLEPESPMSATEPAGDFVKDPMPDFAELQADIIVSQDGDDWSDEPLAESDGNAEGINWLTYILLSIPGVLVLAGGYLVYRRLENRAKPAEEESAPILGGDEFASLDDVENLPPDDELDISRLDDDFEEMPAVAEDEGDLTDMLDDLPTPEQTEAPSPAVEDMLDDQPPTLEAEAAPDTGETDPEEELFDISSIDDDLADLDLALDGDDPFADEDDDETDNRS
ncbi:vWA domain-containing protein [Reinekea blandensis]|uniref:VWFA domain-containing protein n=1 Tax=Reinekea blandensis MED297 TaxID=314283 RepID=A4BJQ5_9GAMM|nr:vWA domain-containing protein [Reinekea blandensis]EAR07630.1 hypothetical protein MED297_17512 [Reinekea sp. MED297] [Reinekea blandensis MED297]